MTATPVPDGSVIVTPPAADLTMTIGVKELYDTSVATAAAVRDLTAVLTEFRRDLEGRVRLLERWRYGIGGSIAASAVALIAQFRGGH